METTSHALGSTTPLTHMSSTFSDISEVELRGRLGNKPGDATDMKVLNRIFRAASRGLSRKAVPKHAELLAAQMGLELREP